MTSTARILVICSDSTTAAALTQRLNRFGYAVYGSATAAAHRVGHGAAPHPDLLLVDLDQEERVAEAGRIRGRSGVPVLYLVGEADEPLLERARETDPAGYVVKPLDDRQLRLSIEAALLQRCAGTRERERRDEARRAPRGEFSDVIEGARLSVSGQPSRDANEGLVGGVAVLDDVTKLEDAEEELQRAHVDQTKQIRFMELVFESISDGVVVADSRGRLTMANASAKRIVGMDLTASPSEEWPAIYGTFYPDRSTPFPWEQLPLVRAINGKPTNDVELFVRNPHVPEGVHISVSGRPLQERSGEQSGGVIVFRDVTRWLRTQDALTRAFERGRLEVIETVLHNIGNAINSVATGVETIRNRSRRNELVCRFVDLAEVITAHEEDWIDWLSRDEKGRKVRRFLLALVRDLVAWNESLKRTAERTSSRVRHIVDIIRTQETFADSTVERKVINLAATIADAIKVLEGSLTARAIRVDVDCSRAPEQILVQENAFNQLLVNLLKNAMEAIEALVKLEPDLEHANGFIRVLAYVRGEWLAIDVIDNGVGIAPEYSREIFKAGYTTKVGGTGLGLHSAAIFVGASGGNIEAESGGVGCGTALKVKLPLGPC